MRILDLGIMGAEKEDLPEHCGNTVDSQWKTTAMEGEW